LPPGASLSWAAEPVLLTKLEPSEAATAAIDIRPIKSRLDNEALFTAGIPSV
jgi:hypothetical protein